MKINRFIFFFICIVLFSCKKDPEISHVNRNPGYYLSKIKSNNSFQELIYDQSFRLIKIKIVNNSATDTAEILLNYNASGYLVQSIYYENKNINWISTYQYAGIQIGYSLSRKDSVSTKEIFTTTYNYDSWNRMIKSVTIAKDTNSNYYSGYNTYEFDKNGNTLKKNSYKLNSGNSYQFLGTTEFTYDDKKNIAGRFSILPYGFTIPIIGQDNENFFHNRNNPIKTTYSNPYYYSSYQYEYNGGEYPTNRAENDQRGFVDYMKFEYIIK